MQQAGSGLPWVAIVEWVPWLSCKLALGTTTTWHGCVLQPWEHSYYSLPLKSIEFPWTTSVNRQGCHHAGGGYGTSHPSHAFFSESTTTQSPSDLYACHGTRKYQILSSSLLWDPTWVKGGLPQAFWFCMKDSPEERPTLIFLCSLALCGYMYTLNT